MPRHAARALLIGLACMAACLAAPGAMARTSDRNQPMNVESDSNTCMLDDTGQCTLTGNVVISQGTLDIRSGKAVIYRNDGQPSRAVITGSPAVMRQQMDDGSPMTARASTIDYDLRTEVITLTGNVNIEQPRGTMTGQRVVYDTKSGQVNSGGGQNGGRVRMTIQPRNAPAGQGRQTQAPQQAAPVEPTPAPADDGQDQD